VSFEHGEEVALLGQQPLKPSEHKMAPRRTRRSVWP
jgi:hypothetical protein